MSDLILVIAIVLIIAVAIIIIVARPRNEVAATPRPINQPAKAEIVCVASPTRKGARYAMIGDNGTFGRDSDNSIVLDDILISRHHAAIEFGAGLFTLTDTNSMNGVWMQGRRVYQQQLANGAQFDIGPHTFAFLVASSAGSQPTPLPISGPVMQKLVEVPTNLEDYELQQFITEGGQAKVYMARSRRDGRQVVIKFLVALPMDSDGQYFREKFRQQMMIGMSIRHPHCVRIYGGQIDANPPYIVEEYLAGGTLRRRMQGVLPLQESVRILGQLLDGLAYLHNRGIVHRDLSPENIMFDSQNQARLIDFGLARVAGARQRTQMGMVVGKARYMSAEQAKGDPSKIQSPSDLYSIGVIAYEMLTGRVPFEGNDLEILTQHMQHRPLSPRQINPGIPQKVSDAIMCALEKDPERRFRDAREMATAFGYGVPFSAGDMDQVSSSSKNSQAAQMPASQQISYMPGAQMQTGARLVNVRTNAVIQIAFNGQSNRVLLGREIVNPSDDRMLRRHGQIYFQNGFWWVSEQPDQRSRNGIFHNGAPVLEPHVLRSGDDLRLGDTAVKFFSS